ncbi:MAG: FecR domain-containing protein [Gammaproteobacteria bacterium]
MTGPESNDEADDPVARSLGQGLRRKPLSEEALARVRAAVQAEWQATLPAPKRWRGFKVAALAASVACAALAAAFWLRPSAPLVTVGTIARIETGGLALQSNFHSDRALGVGTVLHAGDTIASQGSALIDLQEGGTLRIAPGSVLTAQSLNEMRLSEGRMYVDLPPGTPRSAAFRVITVSGLIEHLGTQFEVSTVNSDVHIRVREGAIRLLRPSGTETAEAGTELVVPRLGPVVRERVQTHGRSWAWVEALAPDFEIEDRQLMDFLQWAGRETGRQVDFADDHARDVAVRTRLRGSVSGLTPLEAIERVLRTTSLRFELHGEAIRVSSGG